MLLNKNFERELKKKTHHYKNHTQSSQVRNTDKIHEYLRHITPSSILAWEIPRTEKPGRLQSMGPQKESDTT